jgi:hypothetical protein
VEVLVNTHGPVVSRTATNGGDEVAPRGLPMADTIPAGCSGLVMDSATNGGMMLRKRQRLALVAQARYHQRPLADKRKAPVRGQTFPGLYFDMAPR